MIRVGERLTPGGWAIASDSGMSWAVGPVKRRRRGGVEEEYIYRPSYHIRLEKAIDDLRRTILHWHVQQHENLSPTDAIELATEVGVMTDELTGLSHACKGLSETEWDAIPTHDTYMESFGGEEAEKNG